MFRCNLTEIFDLPVVCFHGSPGTPSDFNSVSKLLPEYNFICPPRKGYPSFSSNYQNALSKSSSIVAGYSWGCREALEFCMKKSHLIKGLVLVSPIITQPDRMHPLLEKLLSIPVIDRCILNLFSPILVRSYIEKTSYPIDVSKDYLQKAQDLSEPSVLARSLQEQSEPQLISYATILRSLKSQEIPIHIIYGLHDNFTSVSRSVSMIKKIIPEALIRCIDDGGHALLWTHPRQVSNLVEFIQNMRMFKQSKNLIVKKSLQNALCFSNN